MARIPDKIRSIDGSKEMLKLAVRITDLWFVGTPNKPEQAEMVFVDSKEFRFVEFANVVAGNFVSGLLVGECSHNLCFHFDHNFFGVFSMTYFHFWWFKILLESLIRWSFGMFHRKIPSGEILSCTLWENYCTQFLSYLNERGDDGPMVIILTHARIKDAQGSYPASVSNSFKASKLLINDRILEIQEFKEKYRVEVMVTQNNESSKFLLWDRECAELIGETADDVNRVKIELVNLCCFWQDGDLDLNASPQALDKLLGHVLAFKVRIQSKFKNAVVLRYSKDLDLINVVLEMLPDSEQSLSVTADHDPVAGLPLTPKKRMSSDEADDELGSSQISPAQLSSNKLTRHSHKS
ncbi:hypothetical protein JHK87_027939 [Glycine soja]|nr:hypothetical protein JHK87_027939 [Glycine soja]